MNIEDHNNFKRIPHEDVIDIIGTQYIFEYGESKAKDSLKKMVESPKVSEMFGRIYVQKKMPNPDELLHFVNGLSFFIFSRAETVCLAAISFAGEGFKEMPGTSNEDKVDYIMHIVYKCERTKFNKNDTFYTRIYSRLLNEYNSNHKYLYD